MLALDAGAAGKALVVEDAVGDANGVNDQGTPLRSGRKDVHLGQLHAGLRVEGANGER